MAELKIGTRRFKLPASRIARIIIGSLFVFLGLFGFLPILGFWMIPVGLLILSHDIAAVRRWRRGWPSVAKAEAAARSATLIAEPLATICLAAKAKFHA